MATDDALGTTATSGASVQASPAGAALRAGDQLGRYTIERVLGAGGMGLVYAAHDPDLDRRIAIKVLRADAAGDARVRLLREARAMAKVTHPNVITVYEVGTAAGVDFVAMELLEGGTLADWLRAERRTAPEVLRRFRAAGAGLVAAHARGLVHRDFKPANVLLGRDGRVVVTDFGLARGFDSEALAETLPIEGAPPSPPPSAIAVALDDTLAATPSPAASRTGDLSSTLTRTGAMVGTPAYMAPEQFTGAAVGPAADQFAFAVALWEGLTGKRPFAGNTIDELRGAVDRGPPDAGTLPRAVRPILIRALARQADARWPDVATLLAILERRVARPRRIAVGAAIATGLALATVGVMATQRSHPVASEATVACAVTDADIEHSWSPAIRAPLDQHFGDDPAWIALRVHVDDFAASWRRERASVCAAPTDRAYHGRVACLAGVRDELSAVLTLLPAIPRAMLARANPAELLPSPEVCRSGRRAAMPPLPADPATRAKLSALMRGSALARMQVRSPAPELALTKADEVLTQARAMAASYPPALAIGLETKASVTHVSGDCRAAIPLYEETATAAEAASADGIRAMARIGILECAIGTSSDTAQIQRYVEQARAAIQRAGDDRQLNAALDLTLAELDASAGDIDRAITRSASAHQAFIELSDVRRTGNAALREAALRTQRDRYTDRDEIERLLREALDLRERSLGAGHKETEGIRLELGLLVTDRDPAAGQALVDRAIAAMPVAPEPTATVPVRGRVVDDRGAPVAGAAVVAATGLFAMHTGMVVPNPAIHIARTTSDADGRFELRAAPHAIVQASTATALSAPAAAGTTVVLRATPVASVDVKVAVTRAPIAADTDPAVAMVARAAVVATFVHQRFDMSSFIQFGRRTAIDRWRLTHTFAGKLRIGVAVYSPLGDQLLATTTMTSTPGGSLQRELAVDLRGAVLDVIIRADRGQIPTAQVLVLSGPPPKVMPHTVVDAIELMQHTTRAHIADAAPVIDAARTTAGAALYRSGDIHSRMSAIQPGPATICVFPFAGDLRDPTYSQTLFNRTDLEAKCVPYQVGAAAVQAVVIEAPPMRNAP